MIFLKNTVKPSRCGDKSKENYYLCKSKPLLIGLKTVVSK